MKNAVLAYDIPEYNLRAGEVVKLIAEDERLPAADSRRYAPEVCSGSRGYSVEFRGRKGWIASGEISRLTS